MEVCGIAGLEGIDRSPCKSVELMEFKEAVYQKVLSHAGRQGSRRMTGSGVRCNLALAAVHVCARCSITYK